MTHKRVRNHPPRLPDNIQNLLALHGLRGVPQKRRWRAGAVLAWVFAVVPDKPAPGSTDRHYIATGGWRPCFELKGTAPLETWIARVREYEERGSRGSFQTTPTRLAAFYKGYLDAGTVPWADDSESDAGD